MIPQDNIVHKVNAENNFECYFDCIFTPLSVCKMNVHKRCEKNVANNCGINTRDMAAILNELGISGDKLKGGKKKV